MFKIFATMSKEKTLKKELGILAGIRNCLKSKESVNEGLRYKTLVFYDKAVT